MAIHIQRKLILNADHGTREVAEFDPFVFPLSDDVSIAMIPTDDGMWLTIIQDTPQDLDEVMILPGFQRATAVPGAPPKSLN